MQFNQIRRRLLQKGSKITLPHSANPRTAQSSTQVESQLIPFLSLDPADTTNTPPLISPPLQYVWRHKTKKTKACHHQLTLTETTQQMTSDALSRRKEKSMQMLQAAGGRSAVNRLLNRVITAKGLTSEGTLGLLHLHFQRMLKRVTNLGCTEHRTTIHTFLCQTQTRCHPLIEASL